MGCRCLERAHPLVGVRDGHLGLALVLLLEHALQLGLELIDALPGLAELLRRLLDGDLLGELLLLGALRRRRRIELGVDARRGEHE